ncbi:hypothetical protein [Halomonas binhaiensis]|uniref:Uncharacterized protein n=1 Tax=Halomonas binhaiensis TaxID=2562282 RepID=A0A7U3HWP5_9GAMM|nr:hypothetical protein [Halomonas binhaiensis]QRG26809.1 hypothetical protein E4T21_21500 [Halomonas binhaiensis]
MLKSLLICFSFLVAQLVLLNHIDNRINASSQSAREIVSAPHAAQRERKDDEKLPTS